MAGLGLLQELESTLHLLFAGTVAGHQLQGIGSLLGSLSLVHLGTHLRGIKNGQRIASTDEVALLDTNFQNATGHLAGYAIFRHFDLSLNDFGVSVKGKESDEGYYGHDEGKTQDGQKNIVVLLFCFIHFFFDISLFLLLFSEFRYFGISAFRHFGISLFRNAGFH